MTDRDQRADEQYRSIPRMVLLQAERFTGDLAVLDGDGRLSYRELAAGMLVAGRAMAASGIGRGDTVALLAPNRAQWITAALGIMAAGARVLPVNTRFKGAEAAYVMEKAGARMLVVADSFLTQDYLGMIRNARPSLPALRDAVVLGESGRDGTTGWSDFLRRADSVGEDVVRDRTEGLSPDDDSDVMFTSGTTGHPKGVPLQHGPSLRAYALYNSRYGMGPGDRQLVIGPFFHCLGSKAGWLTALLAGGTVVPVEVFKADAALAAIERDRISHLAGPPTFYQALLDHPARRERDLSSLAAGLIGAAHIPAALIGRMRAELGLRRIVTGYGLTEMHGTGLVSLPEDSPDAVATWSGRPLPGIRTRIVDDDGHDVPAGEKGELLLAGFARMRGYLENDEQTTAVIDADGWLHTGDIAYASRGGDRIKVCDRKKDLVIVGGFNVAPAEVEGILAEWDLVSSAAVIGLPDPLLGEVVAAFVVPAPGAALRPDEVTAWSREHMANYKVPRRVVITETLPLNASGKALKEELRTWVTPRAADG